MICIKNCSEPTYNSEAYKKLVKELPGKWRWTGEYKEYDDFKGVCVCGEKIKNVFLIHNEDGEVREIGCVCIQRFDPLMYKKVMKYARTDCARFKRAMRGYTTDKDKNYVDRIDDVCAHRRDWRTYLQSKKYIDKLIPKLYKISKELSEEYAFLNNLYIDGHITKDEFTIILKNILRDIDILNNNHLHKLAWERGTSLIYHFDLKNAIESRLAQGVK